MKKLMVIALLALAGCTKKHDCMHMHLPGIMLETCSANVHCIESEDETGTMKVCQYVPSEAQEKKEETK